MDFRKRRALPLGLSVMLNMIGLFLLLGAFGVVGSVPLAVGIAGFAVTAGLSLIACIFAFRR